MNGGLQLRDIHLPAEVSWWPPAYGWWVLCLLLLVLLAVLLQRWRKNRPRPVPEVCQPALRELQRLEVEYANQPGQLIRELSVLLRRSAMSLYGRHEVSGLSGADWLTFLDKQAAAENQGEGKQVFSGRFNRMLTELPYREHSDEGNAAELVTVVRHWLLRQQAKRGAKHV